MASRFFFGFGDELMKLAALTSGGGASPGVKPMASTKRPGMMGQLDQSKPDASPIASANRNTGISTPAGQPEQVRGHAATNKINPQRTGQPGKAQSFKAALK